MALVWVAAAEPASGADTPSNPTLADVAWITGSWVGIEADSRIEEHWSEAAGGSMVGSFRMVRGDKAVFYEFMLIEQTDDGVVLRIKHFSPGLDGWEAKDESLDLDLTMTQEGKAVFETEVDGDPERLVYEKTPTGGLIILLEKPAKDSTSEFRFERQ
jgi:hypothetical protein